MAKKQRPQMPKRPKAIKSSFVKNRIQYSFEYDEYGMVIPKAQGHRFIKNYNFNLQRMYKKFANTPKVVQGLKEELEAQGFKLTKSGLISYSESQNINLTSLGYGKDKMNLMSEEGYRRIERNAKEQGDRRRLGTIYQSRMYVDRELAKLDTFYKSNFASSNRYGTRDYDFTKSRAEVEKIAPELFSEYREKHGIKQLTYKQLESAIRKLKKANII